MIASMKIPRKLALSFLLICASAAIVMIVFFMNISMIRSVTDQNNLSQEIHSKTLTLETALLRQNSQLRGFLVTADPTYLKSYDEGRSEYDETSAELEKLLTDPALLEALRKSRAETLSWREKWGDRLIAEVKAGRRDSAQAEVRTAGKSVLVSAAVLPLRAIKDAQAEAIEKNGARQEGAIATATQVLIIGAIALIGIAIGLAVTLSRIIARPISQLTRSMADLAAGRNNIDVPATARGDELGDMARAMLVFRDAAVAKSASDAASAEAEAAQKMVVETVSNHLAELAQGNLTAQITAHFPGEYSVVKTNFNNALSSLRELISSVIEATTSIRTGSNEIAQASEDLARRTEANAASLEETAAAVTQMDQRLKATASAAGQTVERADGTMSTVDNGRSTADEAVQAMTRVSESAKGIDSVIEGLDKIAFQTRVLAMNAAVEAGRAGEAGRGFMVVADLVAALALRAEDQAKQARDMLSETQVDIIQAADAVHDTDTALDTISGDVEAVHDLISAIDHDNHAQSAAVSQVATAMKAMDLVTQQNAAMVEETSAAIRNLSGEVNALAQRAGAFRFQRTGPGAGSRMAAPARDLTTVD